MATTYSLPGVRRLVSTALARRPASAISRSLRTGRAVQSSNRPLSRREPTCFTLQSLERWVLSHLGTTAHERRVVELATSLFQTTHPLHKLSADDLRLLRWAAMVHDVGRAVCDETHPRDGAEMIRRDRSLPLSAADRRHLAFLTRHHRGKNPTDDAKDLLPDDDRVRLVRLLSLLRSADSLDSRSLCRKLHLPPTVVFDLTRSATGDHVLRVDCFLHRDCPKARRVFGRRKKFKLLEKTMGCEVSPKVRTDWAVDAIAS